MSEDISPELIERYKLNAETGRMQWVELARYFAAGRVIVVGKELDLVDVAQQFSRDNKAQTEKWLGDRDIGLVSDEQAREFNDGEFEFWAIVVRPWVLIQRM
jgi:hypothetical protein